MKSMFFVAHFDIDLKCRHIARVNNSTADYLSHGDLHSFFHLHPQAAHQPTPLPQLLLQILAAGGPDWTSPLFRQLFTTTIEMVSVLPFKNATMLVSNVISFTFLYTGQCNTNLYIRKHFVIVCSSICYVRLGTHLY